MDLFSTKAVVSEEEPVTSDVIRNASLVRRLRVLLHAFPLFQLSSTDSRRDESLRHYDTLTIALKILDIIAERMGMEIEADRELIDFLLRPTLESMDRRAGLLVDFNRHTLITDRVLAALRNDAEARRPFKINYNNLEEDGSVTERQIEFRLLEDVFTLSGETVMHLTNEAINLYFNALELDIEDAQAASEAIVHSQLARGKFDEALRSAHYALRQSRLYRDRLSHLLRDTQRDIARVDWRTEAPALIEKAMDHLEERLDTERNIIAKTQDRLDQLIPGTSEAAAVARIADVIQYCVSTHTVLQRELMTVRTTFLDSQANQAFSPSALSFKPNLMTEVLEPLLALGTADAEAVLSTSVPLLLAPLCQPIPSFLSLIDGLLRPRRLPRKDWINLENIEPDHYAVELFKHAPEDREIAENLLKSLQQPISLSGLLAYARAQRYTTSQCEVLTLLVMQHFDDKSTENPIVTVKKNYEMIDDIEYYGDEVIISPYSNIQNYNPDEFDNFDF